MSPFKREIPIGAGTLVIETGRLAKQAHGSCTVRFGDTLVLSTACMQESPSPRGFLPLTVDYREYAFAAGKIPEAKGELPGLSVFLRDGDDVYHTYTTYARGLDIFVNVHNLLDVTPYGRQEEWEDSPEGWPKTSMWWLRHHDRYEDQPATKESCCHADAAT